MYSIICEHQDGTITNLTLKHKREAYVLQQALRFTDLVVILMYEGDQLIQIDYGTFKPVSA